METIEVVIKIDKEKFSIIKNKMYCGIYDSDLYKAIANGIPLPKGHGRLKDIDKIISDGISKGFCDWYDEMKYADVVIEADKEVEE